MKFRLQFNGLPRRALSPATGAREAMRKPQSMLLDRPRHPRIKVERSRRLEGSIMSEIVHDEHASRFETRIDGTAAYAEYRREGGTLTFTHTIVPPELEGQGVGTELVRAGLAGARAAGLKVIPACPFVARYIERHPEEADLLDPAYRRPDEGSEG